MRRHPAVRFGASRTVVFVCVIVTRPSFSSDASIVDELAGLALSHVIAQCHLRISEINLGMVVPFYS
jgi:hypothetical protein